MITPVLEQNAVTDVEVLLAVVEGIKVRFPVSRLHASLLALFLIGLSSYCKACRCCSQIVGRYVP